MKYYYPVLAVVNLFIAAYIVFFKDTSLIINFVAALGFILFAYLFIVMNKIERLDDKIEDIKLNYILKIMGELEQNRIHQNNQNPR